MIDPSAGPEESQRTGEPCNDIIMTLLLTSLSAHSVVGESEIVWAILITAGWRADMYSARNNNINISKVRRAAC